MPTPLPIIIPFAPGPPETARLHGDRLGKNGSSGMLNCREVTQICSEEMERPLAVREHVALRVHLMMCSGRGNSWTW